MAAPPYAPPSPPPPRRRHRGGIAGPVVLIFIGTVFLLQNLGYLPPNAWVNLWRLWPLVLVLGGLELLFAGRLPWLIMAILAVAILVAGVLTLGPSTPVAAPP